MSLTNEQRAAVQCDDNLMLTACPGSGKTRVIISKLARTVNEVKDSPRAVACITYTNAAVYEIEARLRQEIHSDDDRYYEIATIHSFCLNSVFRPFCHLIAGYKRGFKVLTPESEEFERFVIDTCASHNRFNLKFRDFEEFTQLRVNIEGEPVGNAIEYGRLTPDIARSYWARIRKAGFIDYATILYYSYRLLKDTPEILSYVSAKFAWILVDEFQDTTDLQVEILSLISEVGRTRFMLVGDVFQSIFRFAGARPDLSDVLSSRIGARSDIQLSGNFRSSSQIVAHANMLYQRNPAMKAVGRSKACASVPIWRHGNTASEVIIDFFLPALEDLHIPFGDAAILAPTWHSLFGVGQRLRKYGVSIVGPGARPYRRNRLFAPLAEQACGNLVECDTDGIVRMERILFNTILDATGRSYFRIFSYRGRVAVFRLLKVAQELYIAHMDAVGWLSAAADSFARILVDEEYLTAAEYELFAMSVEDMINDMRDRRIRLRYMCARLTGRKAEGESPLDRRHSQDTILREPCAATREGRGEASVAVRVGSAIERRKKRTGVPRRYVTLKATRGRPPWRGLHRLRGVGEHRHARKPLAGTWEASAPSCGVARRIAPGRQVMPKPEMDGRRSQTEA